MPTEPNICEFSTPPDAAALRRSIEYHLRYTIGKTPAAATPDGLAAGGFAGDP